MIIIWKRGLPTPEEVQAHLEKHPVLDEHGYNFGGGLWLVIDDQGNFGPMPSLVRLRVSKPGDYVIENMVQSVTPSNTVVLQNGYTFWQPLNATKWGERSRYLPVTREGLPTGIPYEDVLSPL